MPAPALSAGIEGIGAARAVDERLGSRKDDSRAQKRARLAESSPAERYEWMEAWLVERKKRGDELLASLAQFTGLKITHLQQKMLTPGDPGRDDTLAAADGTLWRKIDVDGKLKGMGNLSFSFTVVDDALVRSPRVVKLSAVLPESVRIALAADGHLKRWVGCWAILDCPFADLCLRSSD